VNASVLQLADTATMGHAQIPFLGRTNIWVEDTIADRQSIELTQSLIGQAVAGTWPGQVEIVVFDDALSGLAAPFAGLNGGGELLLKPLLDHGELRDALTYLRSHIQGVNSVMRGRYASLLDFRREINYPVEGYKLAVLSTDISTLSEDMLNQLSILLKAGPRAGVTFLIHSMTLGANPFLVGMCDLLNVKSSRVLRNGRPLTETWSPLGAQFHIETSERVATSLATAQMEPVEFMALEGIGETWTESSQNGISFPVGKYGLETVQVTLGDELNQRHNVLITGAVGQGKSNLLSVIIHGICQRYSPDEIELYLLDFKEGVTLQQFAPHLPSGAYLPHAKVLGLEADREFGLSVLRYLHSVYKGRMRTFKEQGVQNIREYRIQSGHRMPRILLVVDEFQMLFSDRDRLSDEIADLLIRGARLFRACGIHIVLASQTIGGNMALMGGSGDGLFGQVPIRVALKNSLAESQATLGTRNEAAAHLRAREAIVNLDYGAVSANRKTGIAFADDRVLAVLRQRWWERANGSHAAPAVFNGEVRRSLDDDASNLDQTGPQLPTAALGRRIEVESRLYLLTLEREVGRNVVVVGAGEGTELLASIAGSIAITAGGHVRFILIDPARPPRAGVIELVEFLDATGARVELIDSDALQETLEALRGTLEAQDRFPDPVIVVGFGLDRIRDMPRDFEEICRLGPPLGLHVVGWWNKLDSFKGHVGYAGDSFFDVKVALRGEAQVVKQIMGDPLLEWRPTENRALVLDSSSSEGPIRIIPYTRLVRSLSLKEQK